MKEIKWKIAQFFENLWWQKYLKSKDESEYLHWKNNYWLDFLTKLNFNYKYQENILDVGCGPAGVFVLSEKDHAKSWTALDPLLSKYKGLSIFDQKKYPKVKFVESTFEKFESDEQFDVIFCVNAINHFVNIDENLEKLYKILKPQGKIILSTDTHNYKFLKWFLYSIPLDILHPHQYTDTEYENKIKKAHFKIVNKTLLKKEFIFSYHAYTLSK